MQRVLGVEEEQEEELATEEEWETDDEEAVAPASERAGGVTGGTVAGDGMSLAAGNAIGQTLPASAAAASAGAASNEAARLIQDSTARAEQITADAQANADRSTIAARADAQRRACAQLRNLYDSLMHSPVCECIPGDNIHIVDDGPRRNSHLSRLGSNSPTRTCR